MSAHHPEFITNSLRVYAERCEADEASRKALLDYKLETATLMAEERLKRLGLELPDGAVYAHSELKGTSVEGSVEVWPYVEISWSVTKWHPGGCGKGFFEDFDARIRCTSPQLDERMVIASALVRTPASIGNYLKQWADLGYIELPESS